MLEWCNNENKGMGEKIFVLGSNTRVQFKNSFKQVKIHSSK